IRDWVVSVPETGFLFPAFSEIAREIFLNLKICFPRKKYL
ncbi:MAG: DUF4317 family protein, partial [Clostridium sp.]|nr:DUF4317 family protein [Clostridium sp.]